MRCLVTGANGFLGAALVKRLAADGAFSEVRALVRDGSDASALGSAGTRVSGDVTDSASLLKACEGVEVVFHLAGVRRGASRDDFMRVNAHGTQLVAEAMVKTGGRRFVLCGSLAASGPSSADRPRREEDPFCPEEWYGESKAEAERLAFTFSKQLEVTSCRPSRILGPGDHENLTFFKLVKKGMVIRLLGPERLLSMVDVNDVVAQLILQATKKEAVGEAFFASSDEAVSLETLLRIVAGQLEVKTRTVPVPEQLLKSLGFSADLVSKATGKKLPINRKLARQLLAPGWTCSIDKAKRLLGYQPKVTIAESLKQSCEFYVSQGWL
ncbi:MAG: NAD-dependent epimerase/dehydratase family protein [Myxococcaceae bacterium]